jgi:hypothetical protein
MWLEQEMAKQGRVTCIPANIALEQPLLILQKFWRDHPELINNTDEAMARAMVEAFPCH